VAVIGNLSGQEGFYKGRSGGVLWFLYYPEKPSLTTC